MAIGLQMAPDGNVNLDDFLSNAVMAEETLR
jgi:hypothetical protein